MLRVDIKVYIYIYIYICVCVVVGDRSRWWPKGFLFNRYYTELYGRALLLPLDCSTLPLIRTLYCWLLRSGFKVFGMTRPWIEPRSPGPLPNILPTRPMSQGKTKNPASDLILKIYNELLSRGKIYTLEKNILEKKRKGQPCVTNWKKSKDTQLVGQKKKKHR